MLNDMYFPAIMLPYFCFKGKRQKENYYVRN